MNGHPAAGWYMRAAPVDGCDCSACTAARAGSDTYLGDHSLLAAVAVERHLEAHK
jgi:hypothetical protein